MLYNIFVRYKLNLSEVNKMKFKITTTSTCITEYIVEASNEENAIKEYLNGDFLNKNLVNFYDEEITSIEVNQ